ncbi:MAG: aminoglycoside phosphotransferase family protein [Pseudomonadota bacterium]|nr:aminoglycoside phosphotransferase family protein [Pseudomonadota bacterium]
MLIKHPPTDQIIIDCLNADYGINVVMLTVIPLGADQGSSVYKAIAQDQSSYFIKLKHDHHHGISVDIVELLRKERIQQIIPPIKSVHGGSTQHLQDFTLIVYPFIEGQDGFSRALSHEQWLTLGKTLKQVHETDVPSVMQQNIRQESYSPKWREIVRSFYPHIESPSVADDIALLLLAFMKEKLPTIRQLVDRAEQLAQLLQNETIRFVLCHSDIHGGNVLLDGASTLYIVDWDDSIMAPKERDLMFIGGGVGNVWNNPQEETFFYEGYGKADINMTLMAYYRHERIVEDIALYCQGVLTTAEGNDRSVMYMHFIAMFQPMGVVDIAYITYFNCK